MLICGLPCQQRVGLQPQSYMNLFYNLKMFSLNEENVFLSLNHYIYSSTVVLLQSAALFSTPLVCCCSSPCKLTPYNIISHPPHSTGFKRFNSLCVSLCMLMSHVSSQSSLPVPLPYIPVASTMPSRITTISNSSFSI